jgi:hypothetical protein
MLFSRQISADKIKKSAFICVYLRPVKITTSKRVQYIWYNCS